MTVIVRLTRVRPPVNPLCTSVCRLSPVGAAPPQVFCLQHTGPGARDCCKACQRIFRKAAELPLLHLTRSSRRTHTLTVLKGSAGIQRWAWSTGH